MYDESNLKVCTLHTHHELSRSRHRPV